MKCSLGISNFLEEISSLPILFFSSISLHSSLKKAFLSLLWPLPICLDSWTWHSRFLCCIALYSIGPCFYHQSHPQMGIVFVLAPSLHSFWSYFSIDLQQHIWAPTNPGSSPFSILSFCLFILFMGFSRQGYWSGLPFPSPVDHILSDLSTMTCPSWVAPHGVA